MSVNNGAGLPPHSVVESDFTSHTRLPTTRPSQVLDGAINGVGYAFSWLWLAVIIVILTAVIGRYVFATSSVMLEEIEWHISGAAWMIGLSYTLVSDHHVRVDVLHERFSIKTQACIEMLGIALLLLPFCIVAIDTGWSVFLSSYQQGEVSRSPGGLPARYVLKFLIPLAFTLLAIGGVSRLLKCTALLFGLPRPIRTDASQ